MPDIVTDISINQNWNARKGANNPVTFTFTQNSAAFDISTYTFSVQLRKFGSDTNLLNLTQGSGITNNGAAGTLNVVFTSANLANLVANDYYWQMTVVHPDTFSYLWFQGTFNLYSETYTGDLTTAVTGTIDLNGTTINTAITLGGSGSSMTYPGAGIPLSTGSAWDTSITNNSSNWNTAFGWGNHASAGYLTSLSNGNGTTASGSAVNLGGELSSDVDIYSDALSYHRLRLGYYKPLSGFYLATTNGSQATIIDHTVGAYSRYYTTGSGGTDLNFRIGLTDGVSQYGWQFDANAPTSPNFRVPQDPTTQGWILKLGSDATGDTYYRNSSGYFTRLAAGTNGHVLTLASGIPSWAAPSGSGLSGLTSTRVPFANSSTTITDDSNLTWNNTSKFLTIGDARYSTFGNSNLFIGNGSGNTSIGIGLENLGIGTNALSSITIGNRHTAIGYNAGASQISGSNNTFVGNASGRLNTGSSNTFVGYATGENTTGSNNVAIGNAALQDNTIGIFNTALGAGALTNSVTLSGNTALGGNCLAELTTGTFNVAIGGSASSTGTNMNSSVAIGTNAQFNVSGGTGNIAVGVEAMSGTGTHGSGPNTGSYNVFIGHNAGDFMQSGSSNTALGNGAMAGANTGSNNTALGNQTLTNIDGGDYNIAIGSGTGIGLTSGDNNVLIGKEITAQSNTGSNQLSIMNAIFGTSNSATGTTVSSGNIGIYEASPTARFHLPAGTATANTAPLKFTSGIVTTVSVAGQFEYDNTFHLTNSDSTRRHIALAPNTTKVIAAAPYTNDGYILLNIGGTDFKMMTTA